jgi:SAM-dependent methyltransferase
MNSASSDGYHHALPYPAFFHRELTPGWLATVLAALGYRAPDLTAPYIWCELGCGPGLTTLITAATNPCGQCYAVDFDAAAINHARALADAAAIDNAHFLRLGFAELAEADEATLPPLDFIVLHGVLSWISPENRQAVFRVIDRWLKPGGIVCLAYMSQPGSAPMMAAQRLLRCSVGEAANAKDINAGLAAGFQLLRALRDGGAGQFTVVPELGAQLEQAARHPPGYLAHEFLGAHWEPLHVADLLSALSEMGCGFLGSATPLENIDAVSLPTQSLPTIAAIQDTALRETAKDIARNQSLRRDLYQRAPHPLTAAEHRVALEALTLIALPGAPKKGALRFETRIDPVDGHAALFSPLLTALADGKPHRFRDLLKLPEYIGRGGLLNQTIQMLLWGPSGRRCFVGDDGKTSLSAKTSPSAKTARTLNRAIWRRAAAGFDYGGLAAPAIGSGLPVSRVHLLAAYALDQDSSLRGEALLKAIQASDETADMGDSCRL